MQIGTSSYDMKHVTKGKTEASPVLLLATYFLQTRLKKRKDKK